MLASLSKTLIFGVTAGGTGITLNALHISPFPAASRTFSVMVSNRQNYCVVRREELDFEIFQKIVL